VNDLKRTDDKHWNLRDIFKVFLLYLLSMLAGIPVFIKVVKQVFGLDLVETFGQNTILLSLSLVVNIVTCLYIFNIVRTGYGLPVASLGLTTRNWKCDVKTGLKYYLIVLPAIIASGFIVDSVLRAFGIEPKQQDIINNLLNEDSLGVLAFMVFFGMLAAPIVEELLFRGFLQSAVRTTCDKLQTILISGFILR
jgi:membrane protease YdiL (CAAX protease family)